MEGMRYLLRDVCSRERQLDFECVAAHMAIIGLEDLTSDEFPAAGKLEHPRS
jgi:hypothetical protein